MYYTKKQIIEMLDTLSIKDDSILMLHCGDETAALTEGGANGLLDILCERLCNGILIIPTYSWATVRGERNFFDPKVEPSCSGELGMELLRRDGAVRTLHPSYSLAVWGRDAVRFASGEQNCTAPCTRSGCMGKLIDWRAKLLFFGKDLSECTFMRGIEDWSGARDRLESEEIRYIVMEDGSLFMGAMSDYSLSADDAAQNYIKMETPLIKLGAANEFILGEERCVLYDCAKMVRIVSELLILKPELFSDDSAVSRAYIKIIRESLKEKNKKRKRKGHLQ